MKATNYAKLQDRPRSGSESGGSEPLDVRPLLGTWINTNTATAGIAKAVVAQENGDLHLRVFGAGELELYDWGAVPVKSVCAEGICSRRAISFTAEYDFGFLETELQTNLSKGLLIITTLNTFKDGSGRSNYFSREYFYLEPAAV